MEILFWQNHKIPESPLASYYPDLMKCRTHFGASVSIHSNASICLSCYDPIRELCHVMSSNDVIIRSRASVVCSHFANQSRAINMSSTTPQILKLIFWFSDTENAFLSRKHPEWVWEKVEEKCWIDSNVWKHDAWDIIHDWLNYMTWE